MKKVHDLKNGEKFIFHGRIYMRVGSSYDFYTETWHMIDIENGETRFIGKNHEVETCKVKIVKEE